MSRFGFLKDRLIFDVVGIAQECLHTAKSKKLSTIILKLDLKKAYDKVRWKFLRLLLTQIGLNWEVTQWIMACITSVNMEFLMLTGETVHPSTGRVEPVRGCLNNPSRLVWTTLTSLTAPLAALRSRKETKEKVI
jgi:hypothetical protein